MSKPFDSVFKDLLERDPAGWVRLAFGRMPGTATIVDADISTVSGAADKVVLVEGPEATIVHFEAFASWDATLPARGMFYSAAHHRRHLPLPVETVFVVLRPEADHPGLTGVYEFVSPLSGKFRGVPGMEESSTYQMILKEGEERGILRGVERGRREEAIRALLLVGTPRLGEPDADTRQRIEGEGSLDQVEEWLRHVAAIESWSELIRIRV